MKFLLEDGSVVRRARWSPHASAEKAAPRDWISPPDGSQPFLRVIAVIPERRDRLRVLVRLLFLMLSTCIVAAWVVGVWLHLGWHGALNGAGSALIVFPILTLLASVTMGGVWKADDQDDGYFWRVLIGWAMILTVIAVAWVASAHPRLYGG